MTGFQQHHPLNLVYSFYLVFCCSITCSSARHTKQHQPANTIHNATLRLPLRAHSGTHHIQLYVGQPPVQRTLIVDTGSRLTAWTCHPCPTCEKKGRKHYNPEQSTTSSVSMVEARVTPAMRCKANSNNNKESSCHFADVSTCDTSNTDQHRCVLQQRYTEGSTWDAYEVTDMITLGGVVTNTGNSGLLQNGIKNDNRSSNAASVEPPDDHSLSRQSDDYEESLPLATLPFTFGCQTSLSGMFKEQHADGILGMEHSNYSLITALQTTHVLEEVKRSTTDSSNNNKSGRAFSLCLTQTGGWMGLGGGVTERHKTPMRTTPLMKHTTRSTSSKSKGMFAVHVMAVWLGDSICVTCGNKKRKKKDLLDAFNKGKGTILDSGTTDTYLPEYLSPLWEAAWLKLTNTPADNDHPVYLTESERSRYPVVRIVFKNNVTLTVPPEHYMELDEDSKGRPRVRGKKKGYTSRIFTDELDGAVLGINVMLEHDIVFDWDQGVVGIAPADCSSETSRIAQVSNV